MFSEHEQLKMDFIAKDDESRYFMNELAKYKEQFDEKLVTRLTEQIDSLNLDITMLTMRVILFQCVIFCRITTSEKM